MQPDEAVAELPHDPGRPEDHAGDPVPDPWDPASPPAGPRPRTPRPLPPQPLASWVLVPCLVALRAEFDALAPRRDRASDGSIGDPAHARSSSDHNPDETGVTPYEDADSRNEVHAVDIDDSGPWPPGVTMQRCVQEVVLNHRAGRDGRLQNVIHERRIWSGSWGWTARAYTGANPHDQHAHFSARYTAAQENDTSSWGIEDLMALTDEDKRWLLANLARAGTAAGRTIGGTLDALAQSGPANWIGRRVWEYELPDPRSLPATRSTGTFLRYTGSDVDAAADRVIAAVAAALETVATAENVDERALADALAPAVATAVLAALPPDLALDGLDRSDVGAAVRAAVAEVFPRQAGPRT